MARGPCPARLTGTKPLLEKKQWCRDRRAPFVAHPSPLFCLCTTRCSIRRPTPAVWWCWCGAVCVLAGSCWCAAGWVLTGGHRRFHPPIFGKPQCTYPRRPRSTHQSQKLRMAGAVIVLAIGGVSIAKGPRAHAWLSRRWSTGRSPFSSAVRGPQLDVGPPTSTGNPPRQTGLPPETRGASQPVPLAGYERQNEVQGHRWSHTHLARQRIFSTFLRVKRKKSITHSTQHSFVMTKVALQYSLDI